MKMEIIFDGLILFLLTISLFICLILLILIVISSRSFTSKVSILLIFNVYLSIFFTSIMMSIIYIYNLYGDLYPLIIVNDGWCQIRAYLVNVCFCSLYYSCVLKSIFRLIRIIFYKSKYLRSFFVFFNLIVFQWFISFILILWNFFNGDYQYLPKQYRCWISFENFRGLLLAATIIYICPLTIMFTIYIFIIRHVRQTNPTQQKHQKTVERDILVLKRITVFIFVVVLIGLPTVSILFIWIFTGKLIPMAYHIQGLSMAIGLFVAAISFAFISPQIQELFYSKERYIHSPKVIRACPETIQEDLEETVLN